MLLWRPITVVHSYLLYSQTLNKLEKFTEMSDNGAVNPDAEKPTQASLKQDARDARLSSMRKTVEENLRKKFQGQAREQCHEESVAFGKCAQENGFWVVFKCRDLSDKMNRCMDRFYDEDKFQEYLAKIRASGEYPTPGK